MAGTAPVVAGDHCPASISSPSRLFWLQYEQSHRRLCHPQEVSQLDEYESLHGLYRISVTLDDGRWLVLMHSN